MGTARRWIVAGLASLMGAALLPLSTAPAQAATGVVTAVGITYQPQDVTIAEGDSLEFVNLDGPIPHDVVSGSPATGPDGQFASATINAAGSPTPVEGVETLATGTYSFYCTIHPTEMQGTLTVEPGDGGGGGLPVPDAPSGAITLGHLVPTPTSLTVHGDSMFIASWSTGTIFRAPILDGGLLGAADSFATGFSNPLGVQVDDRGVVYVADSHPSARADRSTAGRVTAIPPDGGDRAAVGQTLVDELPNGRHNTNGMAVHDGRLYITNGNSTDDGVAGGEPEEPLSGSLVSIPLPTLPLDPAAAPIVVDPADGLAVPGLQVEAIGMRNDYDVAFRPGTSEAWITMNGLDMQDPYGEDLLLVADVADSDIEDFGFPGCQYAAGDPEPLVQQNTNPEVDDICGDDHVPPAALLGLHTSADGLAFGPAGTSFQGAVYIARFGNFFGREVVGHDVAMVPVDANGTAGEATTFLPGPAPLDLTFGPAGLYVADFSGAITLVPAP